MEHNLALSLRLGQRLYREIVKRSPRIAHKLDPAVAVAGHDDLDDFLVIDDRREGPVVLHDDLEVVRLAQDITLVIVGPWNLIPCHRHEPSQRIIIRPLNNPSIPLIVAIRIATDGYITISDIEHIN